MFCLQQWIKFENQLTDKIFAAPCRICYNFVFCVSQGSVATCSRYGWLYCNSFVGNLVLSVKVFLPSVKKWQSLHQSLVRSKFQGCSFFWTNSMSGISTHTAKYSLYITTVITAVLQIYHIALTFKLLI